MQEKQKRHHAWSPDQYGADASGQGVQDDAACLAAFCAARSDTAHLAPSFAALAKQPKLLHKYENGPHSMDSHCSNPTTQSIIIRDDGQAAEDRHEADHCSEHMPTHDSWQRQLIEATEELAERFQALLSLPPAQVGLFHAWLGLPGPAVQ